MEGQEIGLVLSREAVPPTSALASKISACIAAAVARPPPQSDAKAAVKRLGAGEEEVESLVGINDALESLERQLASLQDSKMQKISKLIKHKNIKILLPITKKQETLKTTHTTRIQKLEAQEMMKRS